MSGTETGTKPKIALLLADVDGTLVTQEKILTDEAIAAARALRAGGIRLAITSGRPPRGMAMLIEPLALDTPIAGFNGGAFVKPDLTPIELHTLDPDAAKTALDLLLEKKLDVWVYSGEDWLIRDKDAPHVAREAWTVKFEAKVVPEFTAEHLRKAVKIVGVSDDHALVEQAEKAAQDALGDQASAARSQPYYLDITHPDANKGTVVGSLSRMLRIPAEKIATIGDMPNDVLMFRKSGFSIAMGNASKDVQQRAKAVTESNEQNGFAKAVHRFLLESPR